MKKRLFPLLSAAAIMLTTTPLQAFAAADLVLSAESGTIECVEDYCFTMPVTAESNAGYAAGTIDVTWDSSALILTDVIYDPERAPENNPAEPDGTSGSCRLAFGDYLAQDAFTGTGTFFVLEFKVAEGAQPGDYPVTLTDTGIYDPELNKVQTEFRSGTITLTEKADMEISAEGAHADITSGLEVEVPVRADVNPGYAVGIMNAHWDTDVLTLKEIRYNAELAPANQPAPEDLLCSRLYPRVTGCQPVGNKLMV